ncbi:hypothetical protein CFI10_11545 [Marinobacterium iners]|uniref:hypothetical protein n=1 Tax=Marinobacterium iners TaxID=48076 RepID=UPI001A8F4A47|nr:hypothetical protein [Marinobacterium iners]QSR35623.1 hypothetical protein CFI10_11545 [Marinobacterium iners]
MNKEDIKVNFFTDSLTLAQRAIYTGIIVSIVAYWSISSSEDPQFYTIPVISVKVPTFEAFTLTMLLLYLLCGVVASFAVLKAIDNWKSIADKELANTLLQMPNTLLGNRFLRAVSYGFFFMIGYTLAEAIFDYSYHQTYFLSCVLASPYFVATSYTSDLSPHKIQPLEQG